MRDNLQMELTNSEKGKHSFIYNKESLNQPSSLSIQSKTFIKATPISIKFLISTRLKKSSFYYFIHQTGQKISGSNKTKLSQLIKSHKMS